MGGSGASALEGETNIASKETTIIEVGDDGDFVRYLSLKPLTEVEQILLVIDPRSHPHREIAQTLFGEPPEEWTNLDKTKCVTFMLMPSRTSSPECLLCVEVGLQCLSLAGFRIPSNDVRVVRIDDYLHHGHAILKAMMESGKKVSPAEEVSSMLGFFE